MNWVDLVVLAIVLVSGLLAVMRGLVREVLGIAAWVAAALIAYKAMPYVAPWTRQQVTDPGVGDVLALGGVFLVALIILWFVVGVIGGLVRDSALGSLDRTLGLVFGLARGAVLVCAAYILAGFVIPPDNWPPPVREARSLTPAYEGAAWLASQLPPPYRPAVLKPPAGRTTTAAALMRATPAGRALSPPPVRD